MRDNIENGASPNIEKSLGIKSATDHKTYVNLLEMFPCHDFLEEKEHPLDLAQAMGLEGYRIFRTRDGKGIGFMKPKWQSCFNINHPTFEELDINPKGWVPLNPPKPTIPERIQTSVQTIGGGFKEVAKKIHKNYIMPSIYSTLKRLGFKKEALPEKITDANFNYYQTDINFDP